VCEFSYDEKAYSSPKWNYQDLPSYPPQHPISRTEDRGAATVLGTAALGTPAGLFAPGRVAAASPVMLLRSDEQLHLQSVGARVSNPEACKHKRVRASGTVIERHVGPIHNKKQRQERIGKLFGNLNVAGVRAPDLDNKVGIWFLFTVS
jgi:hypothetical protein